MSIDRLLSENIEGQDGAAKPPGQAVSIQTGGTHVAEQVLDAETLGKVRRVLTDGTPANTRLAYRGDLAYFRAWRTASGFRDEWPVDPEVLVRFVVEHVDGLPEAIDRKLVEEGPKRAMGIHAWSTVERRVAAIATAHRTKGLISPTGHPLVMEMIGRARRAAVARGWAPKRKNAAVRDIVERMLATCDDKSLTGIRDKALLLFGFSTGGRRRSEISEATMDRLEKVGDEYIYRMGRTKTEQTGGDRPVPVTGRAAAALTAWLDASEIETGPIFRAVWDSGTVMPEPISTHTIARIVKRRATMIGLDAAVFSGHSLRSGFLTEAGKRGHSLLDAMALTGHKDVQTASIYYRAGEVLRLKAGRLMEDGLPDVAPVASEIPAETLAETPQEPVPDGVEDGLAVEFLAEIVAEPTDQEGASDDQPAKTTPEIPVDKMEVVFTLPEEIPSQKPVDNSTTPKATAETEPKPIVQSPFPRPSFLSPRKPPDDGR